MRDGLLESLVAEGAAQQLNVVFVIIDQQDSQIFAG
jgi:hypothetical protein